MSRPVLGVDARYGLRSLRRGVGEYAYQVYRALADMSRSYDIVLYGDGLADHEVVREFQSAYRVRTLNVRPFALWEQRAWPNAAKEDHVQLIHGTANMAPLVWNGPLVLTIHDVIEWHRGKEFPSAIPCRHHISRMYRMNVLKRVACAADLVFTDSRHAASDLERVLHVLPSRMRVIPLASKVTPIAVPNYSKSNYYLALGALDPRKNLVGIFRGFANAHLVGTRLKVIGLEPNAVPSARELVSRFGLVDTVDLEEMVSEDAIRELYANALGLIYLSYFEGFGLPVLEAMALGCPVIASDRSAIPEMVGESGLLLNPDDGPALSKALVRVAEDVRLRNHFIDAGLKTAGSYTWKKTAELTHLGLEAIVRESS